MNGLLRMLQQMVAETTSSPEMKEAAAASKIRNGIGKDHVIKIKQIGGQYPRETAAALKCLDDVSGRIAEEMGRVTSAIQMSPSVVGLLIYECLEKQLRVFADGVVVLSEEFLKECSAKEEGKDTDPENDMGLM